MRKTLEDFKDKHKGEEVIVVCNGPGLKNIPFGFIESRTNFAMNFFSHWVPWIRVDYWLVLDPICFKAMVPAEGSIKFLKAHHQHLFDEYPDDDLVFYSMRDRIPGFTYTEDWGTKYSTTAIAAAHLAKYMGASKVLLVGFDCTYGIGLYQNLPDFEGLSRIPHFYDPKNHFSGYSGMWDEHFRDFAAWAEEDGMEVVNLSTPTQSKYLKRGEYQDYWSPEDFNGRK